MTTTPQNYKKPYHTYPVFSAEGGYEGALKQFTSMPTPRDVFNYAMLGLPKFFPLTKEPITPELFQPYLESAIVELQMVMNMDLTPTQHFQSFDYVDGCFENNWSGFKLQQWPATEITQMQLKFPHTQTASTFQTYTIPPVWIALRRNRINVAASYGAVSIQANSTDNASAAGIFSYITGFTRGAYQPAMVEIQYVSGWSNDRLPSNVADLVKTWAAWRALPDLFAPLFPVAGTSVGIDSVSQSANIPMAQMLQIRIKMLNDKRQQLQNSITAGLGRTIKMNFV